MLKAYLSTKPFSLSAFMISKTHIIAQNPHRKQLNAKVCSSASSLCLILSLFRPLCSNTNSNGSKIHHDSSTNLMLTTAQSSTTTQRLHRFKFTKLFTTLPNCCPLWRTAFSNLVRICTCSHVPRPKTAIHCQQWWCFNNYPSPATTA